jgi:hypothetical protein
MVHDPALSRHLPELWDLIAAVGAGIELGTIADEGDLRERVVPFFTAERLDEIDARVPGWQAMADADGGKTLLHTLAAAAALTLLDEYRAAPPDVQHQLEWIVVLHDLRKEPNGGRDHRHAFRSGAWAGQVLPKLGFPVTPRYQREFTAWFELTDTAHIAAQIADGSEQIQDNAKLALIMGGANRVFASPTTEMVKAITLHQSITVVEGWLVPAPLSEDQERVFLDRATRSLLLPLMLADSGGWNLFEPRARREMYASTRARLSA